MGCRLNAAGGCFWACSAYVMGDAMTNTKQPEALRLADESDNDEWIAGTNQWRKEAANELRRLHEVNAALLEALKTLFPNNLNAINKNVPDTMVIPLDFTYGELRKISAAIAKAEVMK